MLSNVSILIIEDQPEICDLIELSLLDKVSTIYIAHSVTEATILVSQYKIDLAVVDTCLPDGDPYYIVQTLIQKTCKILLMSGNFELNKRLTQLPFPKIEKPFRLPTLIHAIEQAVQTPSIDALTTLRSAS